MKKTIKFDNMQTITVITKESLNIQFQQMMPKWTKEPVKL